MDPYKILGVSQSASDEEVKSAYIELVKKFHPDKYVDNPLKELAQEKLKEINEAYDTITKQRKASGRTSNGYGNNNGYSSGSTAYSGSNAFIYQQVRNLLAVNQLDRAEQLLNNISAGDRNAQWEYLSGIVALRRGSYDNAKVHFQKAVQMDPNNAEYNQAYQSVSGAYTSYSGNPYRAGGNSADLCNVCTSMICLNLCLNGLCFRC